MKYTHYGIITEHNAINLNILSNELLKILNNEGLTSNFRIEALTYNTA